MLRSPIKRESTADRNIWCFDAILVNQTIKKSVEKIYIKISWIEKLRSDKFCKRSRQQQQQVMTKIFVILGIFLMCQMFVKCEKEYYCKSSKLLPQSLNFVNNQNILQHLTKLSTRTWGMLIRSAICCRSKAPSPMMNSWNSPKVLEALGRCTLMWRLTRMPTLSGEFDISLERNMLEEFSKDWFKKEISKNKRKSSTKCLAISFKLPLNNEFYSNKEITDSSDKIKLKIVKQRVTRSRQISTLSSRETWNFLVFQTQPMTRQEGSF